MRRVLQELELVRDQDNDLVSKCFANAFKEDLVGHFRINSTQRIVKQNNLGIRVDSSCQADSRFLASRDIDSSFANDCLHPFAQYLDISQQLRHLNRTFELGFVIRNTKQDVFLD